MSETENTQNLIEIAESVKSSSETNEPETNANKAKVPKNDKKRKGAKTPTEEDAGSWKPTKPKSWTWDHFTKELAPRSLNPRARCNWCGATYACDTHKNGTSNLKNHLLTQCKKFPKSSNDSSQTILSIQQLKKEDGKGIGNTFAAVAFDVEACRQALARMIIVDELPFKFVEGEGFRYFMIVVQPKLTIPGRITIARDCVGNKMKHKKGGLNCVSKLLKLFANIGRWLLKTLDAQLGSNIGRTVFSEIFDAQSAKTLDAQKCEILDAQKIGR